MDFDRKFIWITQMLLLFGIIGVIGTIIWLLYGLYWCLTHVVITLI